MKRYKRVLIWVGSVVGVICVGAGLHQFDSDSQSMGIVMISAVLIAAVYMGRYSVFHFEPNKAKGYFDKNTIDRKLICAAVCRDRRLQRD